MGEKNIRWLSHTAIEAKNRCPRCFWLYYKQGISPPEGIQSRLANRFDVVLKNYFNSFRVRNQLPPMVRGYLSGKLQNPLRERYYFRLSEQYGFFGKLDECLVTPAGEHIPVDFKTTSSDPRKEAGEDRKKLLKIYHHQIEEYIFLMEKNKIKTAGFGFLIFFYPDLSETIHNGFPMVMKIIKVTAEPTGVIQRIKDAVDILEGEIPKPASDCPFCRWFSMVKEYY